MDYIKQMTVQEYYSRPTNRACHDYCVDLHMPVGARSLLGLGLKYCVKKTHPRNNYKKSIERFKSDVRRINWFIENPPEDDGIDEERKYTPGLYWKSDWEPPPASQKIERCLNRFEKELTRQQKTYHKTSLSNFVEGDNSGR